MNIDPISPAGIQDTLDLIHNPASFLGVVPKADPVSLVDALVLTAELTAIIPLIVDVDGAGQIVSVKGSYSCRCYPKDMATPDLEDLGELLAECEPLRRQVVFQMQNDMPADYEDQWRAMRNQTNITWRAMRNDTTISVSGVWSGRSATPKGEPFIQFRVDAVAE